TGGGDGRRRPAEEAARHHDSGEEHRTGALGRGREPGSALGRTPGGGRRALGLPGSTRNIWKQRRLSGGMKKRGQLHRRDSRAFVPVVVVVGYGFPPKIAVIAGTNSRVVYGRAESTPFHFRAIGMDGHPPQQSSDDTPPPDDRLDEDAPAATDASSTARTAPRRGRRKGWAEG
ncbi:hypothetical protein THAOC_08857, partial [Thalassiosira oceanica]